MSRGLSGRLGPTVWPALQGRRSCIARSRSKYPMAFLRWAKWPTEDYPIDIPQSPRCRPQLIKRTFADPGEIVESSHTFMLELLKASGQYALRICHDIAQFELHCGRQPHFASCETEQRIARRSQCPEQYLALGSRLVGCFDAFGALH